MWEKAWHIVYMYVYTYRLSFRFECNSTLNYFVIRAIKFTILKFMRFYGVERLDYLWQEKDSKWCYKFNYR